MGRVVFTFFLGGVLSWTPFFFWFLVPPRKTPSFHVLFGTLHKMVNVPDIEPIFFVRCKECSWLLILLVK